MTMFKAIFWDNDGILVETELYYYLANQQVLKEISVELSLNAYKDISLKQGKSVFDLAREQHVDERIIKELQQKRNRVYADLLYENRYKLLLTNVEEALKELKEHYVMGVVTSCRAEHFDIIHQKTNILHYFNFILKREDYTYSKPNPEHI